MGGQSLDCAILAPAPLVKIVFRGENRWGEIVKLLTTQGVNRAYSGERDPLRSNPYSIQFSEFKCER